MARRFSSIAFVSSGTPEAEAALATLCARYPCSDPEHADVIVALGGAPEYPHYTRPADWRGWTVPEVLLSGHHARIRDWRAEQSRERAREPGGASLP